MAPTWKRLVSELTARGVSSPYLDRLRARLDAESALDDLEKEIVREMASALGRAEDKVNLSLLELDLAGREVTAATERGDATARASAARRFNDLRRAALRARHELQIHREAVGLRRNRVLEEIYPVPPRLPEDDGA